MVVMAGLLCLLTPAAASAAVRFAAPGGNGTACTQLSPCNIQIAVEDAAVVDGDEVVLGPGTYSTGTDPLVAGDAIDIHPAPGAGRPLIDSNVGFAFVIGDVGASVENVEVHVSVGGIAIILGAGTRAERVTAIASAPGGIGCYLAANQPSPPLLRNSACIATGSGGNAARGSAGVSAGVNAVARFRNVTAVATGASSTGVRADSSGNGGSVTVDAVNVIASGTGADVTAIGGSGGSASVASMSFSDFDTQSEQGNGTATDPGSDTNLTAPALLVNPAAGDVHQRPGSWTIDRGSNDVPADSLDIDGESHRQGSAPDIGADEFTTLRRSTKCSGESATIIASSNATPVIGTPKHDVIIGTAGADVILSGGGNDLICSLGGRDTIRGGDGSDRVRSAGAGDKIFGQGVNDRLLGGGGRDSIKGGKGNDLIIGGGGKDRCVGGAGKNRTARCE
jgi:Ca2+-binding RTX toxin-like protein